MATQNDISDSGVSVKKVWRIARWRQLYEPDDSRRKGKRSPLSYVKLHVYGDNEFINAQQVQQTRRAIVRAGGSRGPELWAVWTWLLQAAADRHEFRGFFINFRNQAADAAEIAEMIDPCIISPEQVTWALGLLSGPGLGLVQQVDICEVTDRWMRNAGKDCSRVVNLWLSDAGQVIEGDTRQAALVQAGLATTQGEALRAGEMPNSPQKDAEQAAEGKKSQTRPDTRPGSPEFSGERRNAAESSAPVIVINTTETGVTGDTTQLNTTGTDAVGLRPAASALAEHDPTAIAEQEHDTMTQHDQTDQQPTPRPANGSPDPQAHPEAAASGGARPTPQTDAEGEQRTSCTANPSRQDCGRGDTPPAATDRPTRHGQQHAGGRKLAGLPSVLVCRQPRNVAEMICAKLQLAKEWPDRPVRDRHSDQAAIENLWTDMLDEFSDARISDADLQEFTAMRFGHAESLGSNRTFGTTAISLREEQKEFDCNGQPVMGSYAFYGVDADDPCAVGRVNIKARAKIWMGKTKKSCKSFIAEVAARTAPAAAVGPATQQSAAYPAGAAPTTPRPAAHHALAAPAPAGALGTPAGVRGTGLNEGPGIG